VAPSSVVEALDVLEDRIRELDPRYPAPPVEQLDLHAAPERLDDRSYGSPTVPSEGSSPALFARDVKAQEVNWVP
jgi:hypothetical protein